MTIARGSDLTMYDSTVRVLYDVTLKEFENISTKDNGPKFHVKLE